jgi:predicted secreted protein
MKRLNLFRNSKTNSLSFFCFLPLLLLLMAVNNGMTVNKETGDKKVITITSKNNGQTVEIENGEILRIELEELGSAGYQWQLEELDHEYLVLVSKETRDLAKGRVGAPVMAIWLLKTKKIGQTGISMAHYRTWEGKEKASAHFSIKLIIK